MRVHDCAEFGWSFEAGQQCGCGARRNRDHNGIVGPDRNTIVAAEFQSVNALRAHHELAQLVTETDAGAFVLQQLDRRLDQNRAQAIAGDQRPARLSAGEQGFPHHRAGKARGTLGRVDVERRKQQRLHEAVVEHALAGYGIADQLVGRRPNQRHECEVIGQTGIGDAASLIEHPQWQPAVAEVELPALPGREIDKRELRALGPDQPCLGADRPRIGQRVAVARQQKVVAIVDGQVGRRIEIRTAAAACLLRGLVDMHAPIRVRQSHGCRKAGNSGANDMNAVLHQMKA